MHVIATAGHVDHGKSTLVRALTGMEPDRLAEEQRRGLTIDLGFAWTTLPSGRELAFVDVPGHERFLGNMLAGVGPAPAVCFAVAADQGWQAQSSDHRDALAAFGIEHGIVAITRADLASPQRLAETKAETIAQLRGTPLEGVPIVALSATTGAGLAEFRERLDELLTGLPVPDAGARVRFWVDRSFSIRGSGTVVTGSLTAGTLRRGEQLSLVGEDRAHISALGSTHISARGNTHSGAGRASGRTAAGRTVSVRGLHSLGAAVEAATPAARVAVNLREVSTDEVHRGDALVTPDSWPIVRTIDVRRTTGTAFGDVPQQLVVHLGTAAIPARLRPFGEDHARLTLQRALPLQLGDRLVLRSPGGRSVLSGALVLDVDPPSLRRRGDGARRDAELTGRPASGDPVAEVRRRGAMPVALLRRFGVIGPAATPEGPAAVPEGLIAVGPDGEWWLHPPALDRWAQALRAAVAKKLSDEPLAAGLTEGAALALLRREDPPLPSASLLPVVVHHSGLESQRGALRPPGAAAGLGSAEDSVAKLERRLGEHPFAAPEADDLVQLRLGPRELAAAERTGRLLRLRDGVILLPSAPALAMQHLSALPQPFTTSEARQALRTTRRVAIPLLEHLDSRGWTRRIDSSRRTIVR